MKIVQSFWSKPINSSENKSLSDRRSGGWINSLYYYMSWAFSCLQFREFYDQVELVTDSTGYDLLINNMKLPYTDCHVVLDNLHHYHPDLWALGKIYTYKLQKTPFIHADSDVFIWDRLPKELEKSELLAQNQELNFGFYSDQYKEIKEHFDYVPEDIVTQYRKTNTLKACNAGIIGGNNLDFFQEYTEKAIETVNKNVHLMEDFDKGTFNMFYEQCLFFSMAENQNKEIEYLLNNSSDNFDGIANLAAAPFHIKYAHIIGPFKSDKAIGDLLVHMLLEKYPEYYFRIVKLVHEYKIL
ncbi:MAG: DUF6734 family protein [Bacteroidota bacterium]